MLYKALDQNGCAMHGGKSKWALPKGDKPGRWMPRLMGLIMCEHGYHLVRDATLLEWLGPRIFEAEARGAMMEEESKLCCESARLLRECTGWNERNARLFACDCAERALARSEQPDPRSVEAIRVSRAFANGEATSEQLAAAWAAAWAAARAAAEAARAAGDAAGDAAHTDIHRQMCLILWGRVPDEQGA